MLNYYIYGEQGLGKSEFIKKFVPKKSAFISDFYNGFVKDVCPGYKAVVFTNGMPKLKKWELESFKAFLTSKTLKFRKPYSEIETEVKRPMVIIESNVPPTEEIIRLFTVIKFIKPC